MDAQQKISRRGVGMAKVLIAFALLVAAIVGSVVNRHRSCRERTRSERKKLAFQARKAIDTGGFNVVLPMLKAWPRDASLAEIAERSAASVTATSKSWTECWPVRSCPIIAGSC